MEEKDLNELDHFDKKELNIFNMFKAPSREFDKLNGNYSLKQPIIVIIILVVLSTYAASVIITGESLGAAAQMVVFAAFFAAIAIVVGFLLSALILWGFSNIFGGKINFKQALSLQVLTAIIGILGGFVNTVIVAVFNLNEAGTYTGLGALVSQDEPIWAILSIVDVFSIWTAILIGMGLKVITTLSWGKIVVIVALTIFVPAIFSYFVNTLATGMPS
jgi:hypothetical protein